MHFQNVAILPSILVPLSAVEEQMLLQKLASPTPLGSLKRNGQRDVHIIFCLWAHEPVPGAGRWGAGVTCSTSRQRSDVYCLKNLPRKLGKLLLQSDNNSPSSGSGTGHKRQEGSHNLKIKFTHKHSANVLVLIRGLMVSCPELHPMSSTVMWVFRHPRPSPLAGIFLGEVPTPPSSQRATLCWENPARGWM